MTPDRMLFTRRRIDPDRVVFAGCVVMFALLLVIQWARSDASPEICAVSDGREMYPGQLQRHEGVYVCTVWGGR